MLCERLSVRDVAEMLRLTSSLRLRMSVARMLSESFLPLRKRWLSCAFQISSLVFIDASVYPLRLCWLMSVEKVMPQGNVMFVLAP